MYNLYVILARLINIYQGILVIYVLLSWLPGAYQSKFGELLSRVCEPYLSVFRRFIPPFGGLDFSPIVAFFVLSLAQKGLGALFIMLLS